MNYDFTTTTDQQLDEANQQLDELIKSSKQKLRAVRAEIDRRNLVIKADNALDRMPEKMRVAFETAIAKRAGKNNPAADGKKMEN